jgi:hypothetical protein
MFCFPNVIKHSNIKKDADPGYVKACTETLLKLNHPKYMGW